MSPSVVLASREGNKVFVGCATSPKIIVTSLAAGKVADEWGLPHNVTGLALSPDEKLLAATGGGAEGQIVLVDARTGRVAANFRAGHSPCAPVFSPDGKTIYVCDRFNDDVRFLDAKSGKTLRRVRVQREPIAAALSLDGRWLLVANLLHNGRADATDVSAVVSVIDTQSGMLAKELRLPNGSGSLNDIKVSPDGRYAVVTHLLSRFHLPTTQLDRGWINTNAKTIIDMGRLEVVNTILLDNVDRGAANPWGVGWTADSRTLVIAHAGTHEISIINFAEALDRLAKLPKELATNKVDYLSAARVQSDVPNDLAFLIGLQRRVRLPEDQIGPRSVAVVDNHVVVGNYFSDSLCVLDLTNNYAKWQTMPLGPKPQMTAARKGELYFHDARICFQGWQSCASCHPGDARVDALNWDLLNDGIGNPKNNKSLLLSLRTPPAMSRGVRETGEEAVRAGIRHILFTVQPEEVGKVMDAYLSALKPVPSPYLKSGKLSKAARRGEKLFKSEQMGCAKCHPEGLFTDLQSYDVGTEGKFSKPGDTFDTPTLVELWRTAPYLHDGSATSMTDVLTTRNVGDKHGKTSHLSKDQIAALAEFLLSL